MHRIVFIATSIATFAGAMWFTRVVGSEYAVRAAVSVLMGVLVFWGWSIDARVSREAKRIRTEYVREVFGIDVHATDVSWYDRLLHRIVGS